MHLSHSATGTWVAIALFLNGGTDSISADTFTGGSIGAVSKVSIDHTFVAGATSAQTLSIRFGGHQAGTTTVAGSAHFNGVMNNFLDAEEVQI
jgi:hypothetical protein